MTNEERAVKEEAVRNRFRIFCMYPLAEYTYQIEDEKITESVDGKTLKYIYDNTHRDNPKLLLYDLADITDEDARVVCRILGVYCPENAILSKQVRNDPNIREWTRFSYIRQQHPMDEPEEKVVMNFLKTGDLHGYRGNDYLGNHIQVADYLRSNSYALPYNGIDLFTSGIAELKQRK